MVRKKLAQCKFEVCELKEKDQIVERAIQFFEELYNNNKLDNADDNNASEVDNVPPIRTGETKHALRHMKKNKAPGEDNITADLLKDADDIVTPKLAHLFTECLRQQRRLISWHNAFIILLHKKMRPERPISLLPVTHKLFTRIICNRIGTDLDEKQPREQAGF
ncbi:uncharacterized protein LOC122262290 [Penaeus japonicus]|uniref:uncharacterized protein LOC122262290 n=1 Tax=Penaeus japonicus TaxID=27405 RepID=UPI001C70E37D|nr:uncharacterized protein LOC122262290 [Penaeus japonicus]